MQASAQVEPLIILAEGAEGLDASAGERRHQGRLRAVRFLALLHKRRLALRAIRQDEIVIALMTSPQARTDGPRAALLSLAGFGQGFLSKRESRGV